MNQRPFDSPPALLLDENLHVKRLARQVILCVTAASMAACGGGGGGGVATATPAPVPDPAPASPPQLAPAPALGTNAAMPAIRSQDHLRNVLAYANKGNVTSVSDPTLVPHMAYVDAILAAGLKPDASKLASAFAAAKTQWTAAAGKTVGNRVELQVLAIAMTREQIEPVVGKQAAGKLSLQVHRELLGPSNSYEGRGIFMAEQAQGATRRAAALTDAAQRCSGDAATAAYCGQIFTPRLDGVEVTNAFAQTCASSIETACAVLATPPTTQATRDVQVTNMLKKVASAADECTKGADDCKPAPTESQRVEEAKKVETDAQKIVNTGNNLAKWGKSFLGLSDSESEDIKSIFGTGSGLYKGVKTVGLAYDTLRDVDVSQAFTFNAIWRGVILGDEGNPKWLQGASLVDSIGSLIAGVSTIYGSVGGLLKGILGGGSKASAAQQAQMQAVIRSIESLRKQISGQLNGIDAKLDNVLSIATSTLAAVYSTSASLSEQQAAAQRGLAQLTDAMTAFSQEAQLYAQEAIATYFVQITAPEIETQDGSLWLDQFTQTKSLLTIVAINATEAGPFDSATCNVAADFARPQSASVNALRTCAVELGYGPVRSSRVASQTDTIGWGFWYLIPFVANPSYRSFTENNATIVKSHLTSVIATNIAPLETLRAELQANREVLNAISRKYAATLRDFTLAVDRGMATWLLTAGTGDNRDLTGLSLWGGGSQVPTGYTPKALASGMMSHCEGASVGQSLSLPDWRKLVPEGDPSVVADMLGTAPMTICYRVTGALQGGWSYYTWDRVSDKVKRAFGVMTVQIQVKSGTRVVSSRTQRLPEKGEWCFALVGKSEVDTISGSRPALTMLGQVWTASATGGAECAGTEVPSLANVRDLVTTSTTATVTDWRTTDASSRTALLAANDSSLKSLASRALSYQAEQVALPGVQAADALARLTALKRAAQRAVEFTFPSLARTSDPVRSAFAGSVPLVDGAQMQVLLRSEANTARAIKPDLTTDAQRRMDALVALVNEYQVKVIAGTVVDQDVELLALRTQIEAVIASLP